MLAELPRGPTRECPRELPTVPNRGGYVTDFIFLFDQMVRSQLAARLNGFSVALIRIMQNCPIGDAS
jgi:hypothetical protein